MLNPFIFDPSSAIYKKQFECCKLNQALHGPHHSQPDYMHSPSQPSEPSKSSCDGHHHQTTSLPISPQYTPYSKPCPANQEGHPFMPPRIQHQHVCDVATRATAPISALPNTPIIQSIPSSSFGTKITLRQLMASMSALCSTSEAPAPYVVTSTMVQKTGPETDLSKILYI